MGLVLDACHPQKACSNPTFLQPLAYELIIFNHCQLPWSLNSHCFSEPLNCHCQYWVHILITCVLTLHRHFKPPCLGRLHCYLPNSQIFLNLKLPSNWHPSCSSKTLWWTLGLAKMLNELVVSTLSSILFEALMPSITILIRSHCGDELLWNSSAPFWKSSLGIMVNRQQHRLDAYEANTEMWEYILPTHSWGCLQLHSQNAIIHFHINNTNWVCNSF